MNKVVIIGRITADLNLHRTPNDVASCRFNVAINRKYKNEKTGEYDADFITCVAWRQTAEFICRYFSKGKMIAIEGNLRSGNYQDKNYPDVKHFTTEVYVDNVEFCGDKGSSLNNNAAAPSTNTSTDYVAPVQQQAAAAAVEQQQFSLSDFEEILSDGDVPF